MAIEKNNLFDLNEKRTNDILASLESALKQVKKYKKVDIDMICVLPDGSIFNEIITELP